MIRPEITEETFNRVKIMSGKINCSFEDALKILLDRYNELISGGKNVYGKPGFTNITPNKTKSEVVGLYKK